MSTEMEWLKQVLDVFLKNLSVCIDRMRREVDTIRCLAAVDPLESDIATLDEVAWTLHHWRQPHDDL